MSPLELVAALAAARIGSTFNFYREGDGAERRRGRLHDYLAARADARLLLVGEAAGYRGARVSGVPMTSERQLAGSGPAEATATIVHRVLAELGIEDDTLLWNVVPTHPHVAGRPATNRCPTRGEVEASLPFLATLARGRRVVAVGRLAEAVLGGPAIRHPAHGGAGEFRRGLHKIVRGERAKGASMDETAVREYAEAHAQAMEEGDLRRAASDLSEEVKQQVGDVMAAIPNPVTKAELVSVEGTGDEAVARIRFAGEGRVTTVDSRWADVGGRPRIVGLAVVEAA